MTRSLPVNVTVTYDAGLRCYLASIHADPTVISDQERLNQRFHALVVYIMNEGLLAPPAAALMSGPRGGILFMPGTVLQLLGIAEIKQASDANQPLRDFLLRRYLRRHGPN